MKKKMCVFLILAAMGLATLFGGNGVLASTDATGNTPKETNEIFLNTNEKSKVTGRHNKDYIVNVENVTDEKIEATFIDSETGEAYCINADEVRASMACFMLLGVVLGSYYFLIC